MSESPVGPPVQGPTGWLAGIRTGPLLWALVISLTVGSGFPPIGRAEEAVDLEFEALEAYAELPLSSVRFLGTHNSYHRWPRLFGIPFLPIAFSGKHRYVQPTLAAQLEGQDDGARAIRQLEIDVHMRRIGNRLGVFHLPWIDNQTSCKTLTRCLAEVLAWSDAREGRHAPVLIWIEPKDETPLDRWLTLGWYEHVDLSRVEEDILSVIPRERILTPDDVRGGEPTLSGAIRKHGWPTLGASMGRFIFALLDESRHRDAYVARSARRNLEGRLMFVRATSGDEPYAAMFKINNAVPTLRELQTFGREALADPELVALQVYPPVPEDEALDSRFETFFKNLWNSMLEDEEGGDGAAASEPEVDENSDHTHGGFAEEKNSLDPALDEMQVSRALHRELEAVAADTRSDARSRHEAAVAALEEEALVSAAPESEELAVVLRNARESRPYREALFVRLRSFLEETERITILQLAAEGFLVTTTADDLTKTEAENKERAASALVSAAQFISTDYFVSQKGSDYTIQFPGRPFDCNALVDRDGCEAARQASSITSTTKTKASSSK